MTPTQAKEANALQDEYDRLMDEIQTLSAEMCKPISDPGWYREAVVELERLELIAERVYDRLNRLVYSTCPHCGVPGCTYGALCPTCGEFVPFQST
jgi:hypothetical protein